MTLPLLGIAALSLLARAPQTPAPAEADVARIETLVQKHMRQPGAVGLSVAVGRGEAMLYERAHGFADLEFAVNADAETMFRIGSVTKQFTAAAVLTLSERNKLSVDDPLTRFLPDYPTHGHEITLRHLLTHTSGIPNYTNLGPRWELDKARERPDEELVGLFQDLPLDFEPGTRWNYSNSGYYLLGMVVAKASGQPWQDFLRATFFEPLKLTRTRIDSNSELMLNRAQGYAFEEGTFQNDGLLALSQPGAAGALLSTAGDLVRWQQALVAGKAVSAASYEEMTLPFLLADGNETKYGMGLQLDAQAAHRRIWHGGGIDGFNSVLMLFPDDGLHIAVISNSERLRADALGQILSEALLGAK
jgi:CubicO group peptidase (beta-lactamase class C family)